MDRKDKSSWWPSSSWRPTWRTAKQFLWVGGIGLAFLFAILWAIDRPNFIGYAPLALVLIFILIRIGYRYEWTGFGETIHPKSEKNEIQPRKTLWDWMSILLVPSILVLLGFGLTWYLNNSEQAKQAQEAARAEVVRAQGVALQAYLDQMSAVIINDFLRASEEDSEVRILAQARTSAALRAVGPENRRTLLLFLYDARLIDRKSTIISLADVDLRRASLRDADLHGSNFSGADLSGADLHGSNLSDSNLSDSNLRHVDLRRANLSGADLSGADLSGADLSGAKGITMEQLESSTPSLEGATMPDGSKHS